MSVQIYDINLGSCINLILILGYIAKYIEFYNWFTHLNLWKAFYLLFVSCNLMVKWINTLTINNNSK